MKSVQNKAIAVFISLCSFVLGFTITKTDSIDREDVLHAQKIIGIDFTETEIDSMLSILEEQKQNFENMRKVNLPNNIPVSYNFNPVPAGKTFDKSKSNFIVSDYSNTVKPGNMNELSFYSIGQLAELIRKRKITSVQLTEFYIERLKEYSNGLHCVVTFTDSAALRQAKEADEEILAGRYRGMLHGIPYGIKDMFFTKNYRTTFGTPPYKNQMINEDATVVKKLQEAGAILIAKLSLGELAMDDVWFEGKTRNPWDTSKGSSGSSAGPASAVSAGLIPFAIGSETWGSIVSPSTVCGVTGLRPTFGRVSRYGAMALSWTMDKIGPICRNVEDCGIVLNEIYGVDGKDLSVSDVPFHYTPEIDLSGIKIGFLKNEFDKDTINLQFNDAALKLLEKMGAQLVEISLPDYPSYDMSVLLMCEAASAFDELTLSNKDDLMIQQNKYSWPNLFRAAHCIPATEYIRANRIRICLLNR